VRESHSDLSRLFRRSRGNRSLAAQIFAAGATPVARVASQIAGAGKPLARAAYVPPNLFNQSPITLPDAGQETIEARIQQRDLLDRLNL
jgi:hypothetical protein